MARVNTNTAAGIAAASKATPPKAPAKAPTKPPTNNTEMLAQANALIAKLQGAVKTTEQGAVELAALNPATITKAPTETNAQFLARKNAAESLARTNLAAENPMFNKAVKPTDAPPGQYYAWIGGTNTGSWQLYNIPGYGTAGTGGGAGGGGGGAGSGNNNQANLKSPEQIAAEAAMAQAQGERQSAYDLLLSQFKLYGLESLVEPLKGLITSGASPAEFTIKLRESDAYKKRFAANAQRIAKGLTAISEAEYLGLEDQYQSIMRNYGLPPDYYARGDMGVQEGFNRFIANDVSAVELEDRISTAQSRVLNANPEVLASLREFYPGITNGDILAYTLDPTKAITDIRRKVTAAEIGGAAMQAGLRTGMARAEELGAAGITKQQAQQGFGTIAGGLQRGSQLASIYGEDPYTQTTAEKEVFGLAGQTEAEKQRKKLTGLEKATFSGQTGLTSGALARDRAGAY
jgi:NADPH-dependent ferric siderophore reductase